MDEVGELELIIRDLNQSSNVVTVHADKRFFATSQGRTGPYTNLPARFGPALVRVGDYVRTVMIPRTFAEEGPGWAKLARRTQRERTQQGYNPQHPILQRTRDLYRELTEKSHPSHIEIIKTGKNARIEIGGSSVKFIQNQLGKGDSGQKLPSRPMIPGTGNLSINERDKAQIKSILIKAIMEK